jgi:hypothetical protein
MQTALHSLLRRLSAERLGWFGAGLSAAAVGVVGYQFVLAALLGGPLPGPQPDPAAASNGGISSPTLRPSPTPYPTRTALPTWTPSPTRTASPTRTPSPTRPPTDTPTSFPTRTPRPTPTPSPSVDLVDELSGLAASEPDVLVGAVATFAARTNAALQPLVATPHP